MIFTYDSNNPTNGIIHWIWTHKKSIYSDVLRVSALSNYSQSQIATNAVDFSDNKYWIATGNYSDEYLNLYFPYYSIRITSYVIQTSKYQAGEHPKIWAFAMSQVNLNFFVN